MNIVLIFIGIILIIFSVIAIGKDSKKPFSNTFNKASEDITDYDIEIGELRREFAETLLDIQKEIEALKKAINTKQFVEESVLDIEKVEEIEDNIKSVELKTEETENIDNKVITAQENNNVRLQEIEELLKAGKTIDEIASEVGIGKGEVLLIKELYLKN